MMKYLIAVILAVAPAAVSAQVLNTIEENLSAANAAIGNGDLAGGHRLASEVMDGVKGKGGNPGAVYAGTENSNPGTKLVSVTKAAKTGKSFWVPVVGKEKDSHKSGLGSFLENDDALMGNEFVGPVVGGPLVGGYYARPGGLSNFWRSRSSRYGGCDRRNSRSCYWGSSSCVKKIYGRRMVMVTPDETRGMSEFGDFEI